MPGEGGKGRDKDRKTRKAQGVKKEATRKRGRAGGQKENLGKGRNWWQNNEKRETLQTGLTERAK